MYWIMQKHLAFKLRPDSLFKFNNINFLKHSIFLNLVWFLAKILTYYSKFPLRTSELTFWRSPPSKILVYRQICPLIWCTGPPSISSELHLHLSKDCWKTQIIKSETVGRMISTEKANYVCTNLWYWLWLEGAPWYLLILCV